MPTVPDIHRRGTRATQPAATTVTIGTLYFVTDENVTERSNGTAWESFSPAPAGGGGAAPLTAPYLVAASDAALSAERVATNSGTVTWDFSTPGQATAHGVDGVVRPGGGWGPMGGARGGSARRRGKPRRMSWPGWCGPRSMRCSTRRAGATRSRSIGLGGGRAGAATAYGQRR